MKVRPTIAGLALAACLLSAGCTSQSAAPQSPPASALTPTATYTVGVGGVEYLQARGGRVLVANATTATVALVTDHGRELFVRSFPGKVLASVRLSATGDRVFVSLMTAAGADPSALWLDETGKTLWQRSGKLKTGLYDANISGDGRSFELFALANGMSPSGKPAFELIDDAGRITGTSLTPRAAVVSVMSSPDLSLTVVTSLVATNTTGETPPTTVVERYAGAKRLDTQTYRQQQGAIYLSPSGKLMLSTIGGTSLSLRSWDSTAALWQQPSEGAAVAAFSKDERRLFTMRIASGQAEDVTVYSSAMEVYDTTDGKVIWSTKWQSEAPLRPETSMDLTRIALVPFSGSGDATLYQLSGDSYAPTPLPAGTTAACFDDGGRLILGTASGITLY